MHVGNSEVAPLHFWVHSEYPLTYVGTPVVQDWRSGSQASTSLQCLHVLSGPLCLLSSSAWIPGDLTLHTALLLSSWSSTRFAVEFTHTPMHSGFQEEAKTLVNSSSHHQVHTLWPTAVLQLLLLSRPLTLFTPISPIVTPVPPKWLGLRPPPASVAGTSGHRATWSDSCCWHQIYSHRSHQ